MRATTAEFVFLLNDDTEMEPKCVRHLLAFMRAHGIPMDALDGGCCRVSGAESPSGGVLVFWLVVQVGYFVVTVSAWGQTAGMRLMGKTV